MPATSGPSSRRGGALRWIAAAGLAAALTACGAGGGAGNPDGAADADAALDTSGASSLLTAVAERLPYAQERRFSDCPILPITDLEESLSAALALPPRQQIWSGTMIQDLTAAQGSGTGGDPTVSCSGTWEQDTRTAVRQLGVIVIVSLDRDDPVDTGRTFRGGQLYTSCSQQANSCLATWQRDHVSVSVSLDGTLSFADAFDSWMTAVIPSVVDGAAEVRVNTVLPPPVTAAPVTPPAATTAPSAPLAPTGEDCESRLFAAVVNYATGAAPIDPVLAAVPAGRAQDVRAYAEETREWVTTDAHAWGLATTDPAGLFGSGQVMASYCLGA